MLLIFEVSDGFHAKIKRAIIAIVAGRVIFGTYTFFFISYTFVPTMLTPIARVGEPINSLFVITWM